MKFKKIILENFRQFSGNNEIDFSLEPSKNITVIHAMNGSGKTTLLESFRWVLYGGQLGLDKPNELLNRDLALIDGNYKVGITLEFLHSGTEYILKRHYRNITVKNKKYSLPAKPRLELIFTEEGSTKHLEEEEAQDIINGFFSRQVADYFFYDGERIKKLGENLKAASNDISRGMDSIMNVFYVKAVVERLRKDILTSYNAQYDTEAQGKLHKLDQELNELENEIAELNRKYLQAEAEIDQKKLEIVEIDNEILKHKNAEEAQKEIIELEKKFNNNAIQIENILSGVEVKKREATKVLTKALGTSIPLAATEYVKTSLQEVLMKKAAIKMQNITLVEEDIQGLSLELLNRMEKFGNCVCGHDLNVYEIEKLKTKIEEVRKVEQLKRAIQDLTYLVQVKLGEGRSVVAYGTFEDQKETYLTLVKKSETLKLKIKNLKDAQNLIYDFQANYDTRDRLQREINQINQQMGAFTTYLKEKTTKKGNNLTQQDQIRESAYLNEKTALHIQTVKDLITLGEASISKKTQKAEAVLIEKTKQFFEEMAHKGTKYIKVKTVPQYRYDVYNKNDDKKSSLSEGERNIASLAYIAGIIAAAKTHYRSSRDSDDLVEDGAEIPLILDAPFAKLDSVHIKNVAKIVPKLADQVILFTVDQQFTGSAQQTVAEQIGKEYEMKNTSDSAVVLTVKE